MQVHLYLPEAQHPAEGLVRAIVKDSMNSYMNISSQIWLDSGMFQQHEMLRFRSHACRGAVVLLLTLAC